MKVEKGNLNSLHKSDYLNVEDEKVLRVLMEQKNMP